MAPTRLKITTRPEAILLVEKWRSESQQIVFTNGCFDLLHLGHIDYLEKAKNLGDKLLVAINDDASVTRIKGKSRPINDLFARSSMLAALAFVDAVISFSEDTPLNLIRSVLPDILVKGDDYEIKDIVGAQEVIDHGGRVETIPLVAGYSTTGLIEKLK